MQQLVCEEAMARDNQVTGEIEYLNTLPGTERHTIPGQTTIGVRSQDKMVQDK